MYVLRLLIEIECNYVQIEKEFLVVVFGMEIFENYIYGRYVVVEFDYKLFEIIYKKNLYSVLKRL